MTKLQEKSLTTRWMSLLDVICEQIQLQFKKYCQKRST